MQNKDIEIVFAVTPNYLKYATVTAISIIHNCLHRKIRIHFLYADIVDITEENELNTIKECVKNSFKFENVDIKFYDCSEKMYLLKDQNIGMWGEISRSHYMYFLSEYIINAEKIIYIDTDIIVNCNIADVFDIDMKYKLVAMASPSGLESMGQDVSNAGFLMFNLKLWREEKVLSKLLAMGKTLRNSNFCAQLLIHNYFKLSNPDRILFLDKNYNVFPHMHKDIDIQDIKVLHYTGYTHCRPWNDYCHLQRGSELWWKFARETSFYEDFLYVYICKKIKSAMKIKFPKIYTIYKFCKKIFRKKWI